jgi:tetratricopeptide (TPR) repeat protein
MGVAATTPWSWGYWPYANPYCSAPVVIDNTTIDYSQPIVLASVPADPAGPTTPLSADASEDQTSPADQSMTLLDTAREAFAAGDYSGALTRCDQAAARQPNSSVAHEFRGLALFALKRYKEAAGPVYAVLSVGPGWDWATLSGFYPDVSVYTGQLRALEQYVQSNPDVVEARFVLAYHYMSCGHTDAAASQFQKVAKLNPQDHLSAQLAAAMTAKPADKPQTATVAPAKPAAPVTAAALAGQWKTTRADGAAITLSLTPDAKYTWAYAQKDKPRTFSGTYSVADNLLILKEGDNPVMVGQVTLLDGNRFNFKLPGDNPSDPGLTFAK